MTKSKISYEIIDKETVSRIKTEMEKYPKHRSALLNALHIVQEVLGWVPPASQRDLAKIFSIPEADVLAVVSFYYMYHRKPVGRYVIKVCRSISCHLCGAPKVTQALKEKLGIELGQTTDDGMFTLLETECVAACNFAPAIQINDRYLDNLSPEKVDDVIQRLKEGWAEYPAANDSVTEGVE